MCCARLFGSWFARSKLNQFFLVTAAVNSRSSSLNKFFRGRRKVPSFSFLRKANSFILCSSRSVKFFSSAEIFCVFNRLFSDSGNHYQKKNIKAKLLINNNRSTLIELLIPRYIKVFKRT